MLVFDGYDKNNKRKYKSITRDTQAEANFAALDYKLNAKPSTKEYSSLTLEEAMSRYIQSKDSVLSPKTIREYIAYSRNAFKGIVNVAVGRLTAELIQETINEYAKTHSPKTVRNAHGLLSVVLKMFRPELILRTSLPQKKPRETKIPSDIEIRQLYKSLNDTSMEVPVLLAANLSLRRGEVCGLKVCDVDFNKKTIRVQRAKVVDKDGNWIVKQPKTVTSNRTVDVPDVILSAIRRLIERDALKDDDFLVTILPNTITGSMGYYCGKAGIPKYTFHELRHYFVSKAHALNVPDQYVIKLTGHKTTYMLTRVYQHIMEEKEKEVRAQVKEEFSRLLQHDLQHDDN